VTAAALFVATSALACQNWRMRTLTLTRHGPPDVMQIRESPDPTPGKGQVLIQVKRAGLTFSDLQARVGMYPDAPKPPTVLGYEVSGVVSALGEGVQNQKVGDRVFALTKFHGQASHLVVDAQLVRPLPEVFSFDEGAAIPVNYLTAFHMLFHVATLKPNDSVLLHMAAGGVGLCVIELSKTVPGVKIFGTASAGKHAMLRTLGVEPIDYHTKDYADEVRRLTGGRGVNLVLDPLGGPDWSKGFELLRPGGHLVAFGWANMVPGERRSLPRAVSQYLGMKRYSPFQLMGVNRTVSGVNLGGLWSELELLGSHLQRLMELGAQGKVKPHVDTVFPLSRGADAHRHVLQHKNVGKVIFDCEA
jgi:NADPH:quinone reductase-like Zn-dependent oxidoreductase